ncbi:MAG: ATP-binding cassette domain-containing protein, partial [Firmicutes bacterium]|nr:ATP-binding cassette domain-containing protein [Bacillota bacterium]
IGLVGSSGSGKTTMANLIPRLYDVSEGSVKVDGIDVRSYDLHALRNQIGVVLQEPLLFHGSVADNIAYGVPNASRQDIIWAAQAANAHDFIMEFADKYDTHIGERGLRLSGGQKQRLAIARAILKNPRILILDEATSAVDTETEKLIQEAIERLIKNRTTIAIAHRLSTLKNADRILVLDKGQIVEEGSHEELMALNGVFARMVRMQSELSSNMLAS